MGRDDRPDAEQPRFYPIGLLETVITALLVLGVVMALAIVFRVDVGVPADPTDTSFVPRPEWYFANVFQLLKFFPGPLEPVGTVLMPVLALIGVLLIPFVDRGTAKRPSQRRRALAGAAVVTVLVLGLMVWGLVS